MEEKTNQYKKFMRFLNDTDNELVIRLGMVIFGAIFGMIFILFSLFFDSGTALYVASNIFGYTLFFGLIIAALVSYFMDN